MQVPPQLQQLRKPSPRGKHRGREYDSSGDLAIDSSTMISEQQFYLLLVLFKLYRQRSGTQVASFCQDSSIPSYLNS